MCDDNHFNLTVQEEDPVLAVHLHNLHAIHQALAMGQVLMKGQYQYVNNGTKFISFSLGQQLI